MRTLVSSSTKVESRAVPLVTNSSTASDRSVSLTSLTVSTSSSGSDSERKRYTRSPSTPSGSREVAMIDTFGAAPADQGNELGDRVDDMLTVVEGDEDVLVLQGGDQEVVG
jgi:hypothetical protein